MTLDMREFYSDKKFLRTYEPTQPVTGTVHTIKCWPKFFKALKSGQKTFEIRENDRDYRVQDFLMIYEWDPDTKKYSGEMITAEITYITEFNQKDNYVVLGLGKVVMAPSLPEGHPFHPETQK